MGRESKAKVLDVVRKAYPLDLPIAEVARQAKLNRVTASTWLRIVEAEGAIEVSRKVGQAVFYRFKNK